MNKLLLLLALFLPMFAATSCGAADAAGPVGEATTKIADLAKGLTGLGDFDVTNLDGLKEKVTGMIPSIDAISKLKETLGDKMPSLDVLKAPVNMLKEKFSGNEGVMGALKPLMDKLTGLMG